MKNFLLLTIFLCSIKHINAINYKLTSIFQNAQTLANFSQWIGKDQTTDLFYTDWCEKSSDIIFNNVLVNMWNNKTIPLITWMMQGCGSSGPPGITKLVNQGVYDGYINEFSDRLKEWLAGNDSIYGNEDDRRAYLRLAHEMNGNWSPYSLNATPTDFVLAWRRVYIIFASKNLDPTRLQWMWSVNNVDVGEYTAEEYWVGDEYTDWVGIDGYNFGPSQKWHTWIWPNQVFDNMTARVRQLSPNKPLAYNEYGCTSIISAQGISNITMKIEWLNQFCDYINKNSVKLATYFNIDKETDWAIYGGQRGDSVWNGVNVYTAYKNCLQTNDWIQPNSTNPRLITDDQFAGRI